MNKSVKQIYAISHGMSEMASKHKNDLISVALARTASKLETYGLPFSRELSDIDYKVIQYYLTNK